MPSTVPARLITQRADLQELILRLLDQARIAVDTESNSLFAYRERVCLIQFSTPESDYLVDPLADLELAPLEPIFSRPRPQKVFHAAEYDLLCLFRDFGFLVKGLFDTMLAARALGIRQTGLGAVLKSEFGVDLDKRWQRSNWGIRPLPEDQMRYAQADTHYLLALQDILARRLKERGLLEEVEEECARLSQACLQVPTNPSADGFWRLRGAFELLPQERAILYQLYLFRENLARELDRPPFKILPQKVLTQVAQTGPGSLEELRAVPGVTPGQAARWGAGILKAVRIGRNAPIPSPPQGARKNWPAIARHEALRRWRKQRAAARGVESDVILSREVLWRIAEQAPGTLEELAAVEGLGPSRFRCYGEEIMRVLADLDRLQA
jgi:ribonuclease D